MGEGGGNRGVGGGMGKGDKGVEEGGGNYGLRKGLNELRGIVMYGEMES